MTDEQIIEAMAKAIAENWDDNFPSTNERDYAARAKDNDYRQAARSAFAVARSIVREQALREAAQMADNLTLAILATVPEKPR